MDFEWNKFIARINNFYWNSPDIMQVLTNYKTLYIKIYEKISFEKNNSQDNQNRETLLKSLFSEIYTTSTMCNLCFTHFLEGAPLYNNVSNACFFTSLCMFLHETTRTKSISLKNFIYTNSLDYYNDKNSKYFCPFDNPSDELLKDIDTLKKRRYRLLSSKPVYHKRKEWAAMAKDSEHEWTFMYVLEAENDTLKDTFKRIGNLYNEINNALASPRGEGFDNTVKRAYKKFSSKLKKIKYENYLELQKVIFDHLCENEKYYGINLYRIEKESRPYITTNEVNQLLACKAIADREAILNRSAILNKIWFPNVYNDFASLDFVSDIEKTSLLFLLLLDIITPINCLLIDELVENNYLGEDWYDFLCELINKLAREIFYNPKDINYTITPESQENFMEIYSAAVQRVIYENTEIILP